MKPILAAQTPMDKVSDISYPVLASPKVDGIRVLMMDGVAVSRNLKPIRNQYVQDELKKIGLLHGLDGEIVVGDPASECFRATTSGVMSGKGEPDFTYMVFDIFGPEVGFQERFKMLNEIVGGTPSPRIKVLEHVLIDNAEELLAYEKSCLDAGYEGVCMRSLDGPYKHGRSTFKEGTLLKLVRKYVEEAEIIGVEERMHNGNEAKKDALGRTERSVHKENLVGRGDLGAVIVKDLKTGVEFSVGTGFNDEERTSLWSQDLTGKIIKYEFRGFGDYDKPRFPVFKGFRDVNDMCATGAR